MFRVLTGTKPPGPASKTGASPLGKGGSSQGSSKGSGGSSGKGLQAQGKGSGGGAKVSIVSTGIRIARGRHGQMVFRSNKKILFVRQLVYLSVQK